MLLLQTTSNSQIPPYYSSEGHTLQCGCRAQKNHASDSDGIDADRSILKDVNMQGVARGSVEVKLKVEKDIWTAKKKEVCCIWFNLSMVPPKLWPIVHTKLLIIVDLLKICLQTHKSVWFKDYIMLFPKRDIMCLGWKVKDSHAQNK